MSATIETSPDPYLNGAYRPVDDELDVATLEVTGAIPPQLHGSFLRNGPNPRFAPSGEYHLFDGDGMIHEVAFEGGRARYRNRWIRSRGLEAEESAGHALYGGMANASFPGPELVGDAGAMKNVANTHVMRHAGQILCLWEAGAPTVIDDSLATLGTTDFGGRLRGPVTAHPKIDPITGEMFAFGYSAIPPYLRYHVIDADGTLRRTVDIDLPAPVMMHDFAITERHAIFLDAPAVFDLSGFASGEPMISWQPDRGTRIGVMSRDGDGSDLRWIEIDNCYVFHFLNAYDEGERVIVDACRLPRMDIGLDRSTGVSDDPPATGYLTRFTVDLTTGRVGHEQLGELPSEFPRIDDRVNGRPHRYGYVAGFAGGTPDPSVPGADGLFDSITAHDLVAATVSRYEAGHGRSVGEPVMAPDPDSSAEGDGWILSYRYDRATDRSDLLVLDATSLADGPVAEIHLPRRVPFGFHGSWLPQES